MQNKAVHSNKLVQKLEESKMYKKAPSGQNIDKYILAEGAFNE